MFGNISGCHNWQGEVLPAWGRGWGFYPTSHNDRIAKKKRTIWPQTSILLNLRDVTYVQRYGILYNWWQIGGGSWILLEPMSATRWRAPRLEGLFVSISKIILLYDPILSSLEYSSRVPCPNLWFPKDLSLLSDLKLVERISGEGSQF